MTEYPRVLVVSSNNFNMVSGGGITLANLFRGWPIDRLANLHEDSRPEDRTVCSRSYRLGAKEIRMAWPFSILVPDSNRSDALSSGTQAESCSVRLSSGIFGDGVPRHFQMSASLEAWLDEFRPDLIYSLLGSMAQIRVTVALSAQYGIPTVIHIMDDWPAVLYRRGLVGPIIRHTVMKEFHSLLRKASARLVISTAMAEDYKIRFGYSFLPFHNALDLNEWRSRSKKSWHASHPFVVRYAGSIIENSQRDALRDIVQAVSELRRSGNDVEMWIHSPAHQRQYLVRMGFEGLHLAEPPPPESIVELLTTADLLVLPFNFDPGSADYIRLSMPTKVPAYMASGTPVLVYGPKNIAAVQYSLNEGWAYVLSQPGVAGVQSGLQRLMSDESLRQSLGRRAQSLAVERHDAARVRAEFQAVLAGAV